MGRGTQLQCTKLSCLNAHQTQKGDLECTLPALAQCCADVSHVLQDGISIENTYPNTSNQKSTRCMR